MKKRKSSGHLMSVLVLLPLCLFTLSTVLSSSAHTQHFITLDGSYGQKNITFPGTYGPIRVHFTGYYKENLLTLLDTIAADYIGKVQDSEVHVKYSISSDGHWYRPSEEKNSLVDLTYLGFGLKEVPKVQGFISEKRSGIEERVATFDDIVFTVTETGKFSCWLVSHSSWPVASRTDMLSDSGLRSSGSIKFERKNVSFFWIEKDFTLTFDANPVWPRGVVGVTSGQVTKH